MKGNQNSKGNTEQKPNENDVDMVEIAAVDTATKVHILEDIKLIEKIKQ